MAWNPWLWRKSAAAALLGATWACATASEAPALSRQNGGFAGLGGAIQGGGGRDPGPLPAGGKADGGMTSPGGSPAEGGAVPTGDARCGLSEAAFCETFEAPSQERGRAGDLDRRIWSAGRFMPQLPTVPKPFPILGAPSPASCRDGLPDTVFPNQDLLVCAPTEQIASSHLWVSTAAQNYGVNSIRVRQPFDFSGRTGKVVFDAELTTPSILFGLVSLAVTEDPVEVPTFAISQNFEGGAVPRNALTLQFGDVCPGQSGAVLSSVIAMKEYVQDILLVSSECIEGPRGALTHVEVELSESNVAVFVNRGTERRQVVSVPVALSFSRGYVQLNVHNHATIKYSADDPGYPNPLKAWTARFDNIGFDGPSRDGFREYEVPDALEAVNIDNESYLAIGYELGAEQSPTGFDFEAVAPEGMSRARVGLNLWVNQFDVDSPALMYRLNQGDWSERPLTDFEINLDGQGWGALALSLEVPIGRLVAGTNRLELATSGIGTSYPPAAANLNLVLTND